MILKIQKTSDKKLGRIGWYFLDNIRKISYDIIPNETLKEIQNIDHNLYVIENSEDEVLKISCRISNTKKDYDDEYIIISNTKIYLLNDNGKTIDCLN